MADKKFEAILTLLVPQVVQLICVNYPVDEIAVSREYYESKVYSLLEQEGTKLWHFSPLTLFNIFEALHTTGANYIVEDIDLYIEARKPAMA